MHIAIDARIISSSTGRYVERLLHYLQDVDTLNTYSILVRKKDEDFWKPTAPNFSVKVADFDNYSFNEQLGFLSFLNKLEADLVHFCMPQQPILYKGKHVTTFHDLTLLNTYNSDKNWLKYHSKQLVGRFVFKHVAQTSAHIITPSKYTKDELVRFTGITPNKVTVTHEAAEQATVAPQAYKQPYKHYLLYVGQQSDYKNIRRLAQAHQRLIRKYPDLGLLLVGGKNDATKANEALFNEKSYKNILFTGFVSDAELAWLYAHAAAYIFPSLMEGFGLPGLEAMTYGAPVVSSNATCLPEVYGDAAHYFDPYDVGDMARAIDEVLSDDMLHGTLTKKGYQQLKKYSWHKMAEQTHEVYIKALNSDQ